MDQSRHPPVPRNSEPDAAADEKAADTIMDRQDIIAAIEEELDDMLADAPEHLSESARNGIKEEYTAYAKRVVDSLSKEELASPSAFERFVQTTLTEARMQMRMRQ